MYEIVRASFVCTARFVLLLGKLIVCVHPRGYTGSPRVGKANCVRRACTCRTEWTFCVFVYMKETERQRQKMWLCVTRDPTPLSSGEG